MPDFRIEKDSMGEMKVPADSYYGASTQRAVENFRISPYRLPRVFLEALGLVKRSAAEVSGKHKWIDPTMAKAIAKAAQEVVEGKWDDQFVVDVFQTGSGTSTNMNANEVIANRAGEMMGGKRGSKKVHPNDHVNFGQSSNDVFPTAMHVSVLLALHEGLIPSLSKLAVSLKKKAKSFDRIVKIGRTHLQDATPIRLGQVFSGYRAQVAESVERLRRSAVPLLELPFGGTAVGTGINAPKGFAAEVIAGLSKSTGLRLRETSNHFSAQGAKDGLIETSGALRTTALALTKIANDIRWLASGPRCGLGEIRLPAVQPGSSIMPGKVNPVIPEALLQVCAKVVGNDATVVAASNLSNFELSTGMPVMIFSILESIELLSNAVETFREKCVDGIEADEERCREMIEKSLALCTALVPKIGYDEAAEIAKEAYKTGKTVREVARKKKVLSERELDELLNPEGMTGRNP
ncbi:MAG: class II fumarate hydratase [Pseudomonadota bacterium]